MVDSGVELGKSFRGARCPKDSEINKVLREPRNCETHKVVRDLCQRRLYKDDTVDYARCNMVPDAK